MTGLNFGYVSADELAEWKYEYGEEDTEPSSPDDIYEYWLDE